MTLIPNYCAEQFIYSLFQHSFKFLVHNIRRTGLGNRGVFALWASTNKIPWTFRPAITTSSRGNSSARNSNCSPSPSISAAPWHTLLCTLSLPYNWLVHCALGLGQRFPALPWCIWSKCITAIAA